MSTLLLLRRCLAICLTALSVTAFAVAYQQASDQPRYDESALESAPAYEWTPRLAARFPGCRSQLPHGVIPRAFLVQRLSGSFEQMAFDDAWRRTHDAAHADDVWVFGACR